MGIMPVQSSPDSLFLEKMESMNRSNNAGVKEGLTRVISLIAYPPITLLSVIYNALAFTIKMPVCLARYTIGFIPTSEGKLADKFPEDSKAYHMAWHAYKTLMFWMDFVPFYPLSVAHPSSNVLAHRKLALIAGAPPLPKRNKEPGDTGLPPFPERPPSQTSKSTGERELPPLPLDEEPYQVAGSTEKKGGHDQNAGLNMMDDLLNNPLFNRKRV